jgi:transposase InsO family protein
MPARVVPEVLQHEAALGEALPEGSSIAVAFQFLQSSPSSHASAKVVTSAATALVIRASAASASYLFQGARGDDDREHLMAVVEQFCRSSRASRPRRRLKTAVRRRAAQGADLGGLVHHSDRGVQYRATRYTQRLAEAGAVASVGSKGDSYDNAMAEAFNSLYKGRTRAQQRSPGAASTTWEWPPSSTSTGTTTDGCTANSDTSHPPNTKHYTR